MSVTRARLLSKTAARQTLQQLCRRHSSSSSSSNTAAAPAMATKIAGVLNAADHPMLVSSEQRERCMEQLRGLPQFPRTKTPSTKREQASAAVLIALCLEQGSNEISLLYTRRSRNLRHHSLQISFPGGMRDSTDASFVDCALRESEEEIGLPRERIQIWGEGTLMQFPRAAAIMPVIGVVPDFHVSQLKLNWDEVEEAYSIPLNALIQPLAVRHTQFRSGYSGPVFVVDQNRIWGITAYLTYVFLRCLLPAQMLPEALKTSVKFIRPYKLAPKLVHHHVEAKAACQENQSPPK